jgi:hypothetical protein
MTAVVQANRRVTAETGAALTMVTPSWNERPMINGTVAAAASTRARTAIAEAFASPWR